MRERPSDSEPTRRELIAAVQRYALDRGTAAAVSATGEGLKEGLCTEFVTAYDLDERGGSCLAPLVADADACPHDGPDAASPLPHGPPIEMESGALWFRDGEAHLFTAHCSRLDGRALRDLLAFADDWDLAVRIDPTSWWAPTRTAVVICYPASRDSPTSELDRDSR